MIHAVRACRTFLPPACLATALLLGGCAGDRPPPAQAADAPHYSCPDGRSFVAQFDPTTQQTDLWLSGDGLHRLDPVPDPIGGVLYQDSSYQLRSGASDTSKALTDRSTTQRQACTRAAVMAGSPSPPP